MKRTILFLFVILSTILLWAQQRTIRGKVVDENGQAIYGANIHLYSNGGNLYTVSDIDGSFNFTYTPDNFNNQMQVFKSSLYSSADFPVTTDKDFFRIILKPRSANSKVVSDSAQYTVQSIRGKIPYLSGTDNRLEVINRNINAKIDKEGYFTLNNVTYNDIIEYNKSFYHYNNYNIGVNSQSAKVGELTVSVQSVKPQSEFSSLLATPVDTLGVLYMTDEMPKNDYYGKYTRIKKIRFNPEKNSFQIKENKSGYYNWKVKVNLRSFMDIATLGALPKRQSEYAQGQGGEWQGADKNEKFSWGTKISELEFTGNAYPYDKNGGLTILGTGNGMPAKSYDPTSFFGTGLSYGNDLGIKIPFFLRGIANLGFGQQNTDKTFIPNASRKEYNLSLRLNEMNLKNLSFDIGALYKNVYEKLPEQGSNMAELMYSVLSTPPTFDNANGLSRKQALVSSEAWQLSDGTQRSYTPLLVSNPYKLVSELSDYNKTNALTTYLKTAYRKEYDSGSWLNWNAQIGYDKQWNSKENADFESYFTRKSFRNRTISKFAGETSLSYLLKNYSTINRYYYHIKMFASYRFAYITDEINRNDQIHSLLSPFAYTNPVYKSLFRNTHDVQYGIELICNNNLNLTIFNSHYFSSTARSSDYLNLFPEISFKTDFNELYDNVQNFIEDLFNYYNFPYIRYVWFSASVKRLIDEAPLVYDNLSALSTDMRAENFKNYFEHSDIFYRNSLKPQTHLTSKASLDFRFNRFSVSATGFYNYTRNFIAPINSFSGFTLENIGETRNYGYYVNLDLSLYKQSNFDANINFNFAKERRIAAKTYENRIFVPLSGFSDIATVFAEGESLGAIYGSSYLRDQAGQIIVSDEGFPMVNTTMTKIGDPTPKFTLTMYPEFRWKRLRVSCVFEYRHGGERWNGTKAMLDYLGISESTAADRDIKNYVFTGVNTTGNENTKAVDFYNPDLDISKNRWVRYGTAGVGEEYIEKVNSFRLSNVSVSFDILKKTDLYLIESITAGFTARNLLLISSYKGVDPSSYLFGYSLGTGGLDLFNMPSTRNFLFTITIKL